MRLPNYLKTIKMDRKNGHLYSIIKFTRFPFEMMFELRTFKFWRYPLFVIRYFKKMKNVNYEVII